MLLPNNQSFSRLYSSQHIPQELLIRTFRHYFESEWIVLSAVHFEYIVFLEGRKCDNLVVIEQIICTRLGRGMSPDVVCHVLVNKAMTVLYWSTVLSLLTDVHHNRPKNW